jgi:hypothetical protein
MTDDLTKKAKRRIKRFVKTQKPVARVRTTETENVFLYIVKHGYEFIYFKMDSIGRLRRVS